MSPPEGIALVGSGTIPNVKSGHGRLEVIFGPMFSGKTTELLRRARRHSIAKNPTIVIKYKADVRYDANRAVTHDKVSCDAVAASSLHEVEDIISAFTVIAIDEGQFFPDLIPYCHKWSNEGRTVIVAGLDGTFQRKPFGNILELIPMAEEVTKLSAVCVTCGYDACFTRRTTNELNVEVIGGADKYVALCRGCFLEMDRKTQTL